MQIPVETMCEARERSLPARMYQNYCDEQDAGFAAIGPTRPTRNMMPPMNLGEPVQLGEQLHLEQEETTQVDGIPEPIDSEETEPMRRDLTS